MNTWNTSSISEQTIKQTAKQNRQVVNDADNEDGEDDEEMEHVRPSKPARDFTHIYADLAKVPTNNNGITQRVLYLKQLKSVGVCTWEKEEPEFEEERTWSQQMTSPFVHLTCWLFGSDQGPDQKACSKMMAKEIVDRVHV